MAGKKIIFVTRSSGLIGSEVCPYFYEQRFVIGEIVASWRKRQA
jgi:hypothetical protein